MTPPLAIRCFGRFQIQVHGRQVDTSAVRPRMRTLLRLLAVQVGRPVHRERILELLWPDLPPSAGVRSLQVAVSNLRALLEPGASRGASRLIVRDGESYLLILPTNGVSDTFEFDHAAYTGRHELAAGRHDAAADAFRTALRHYVGELVPEEGPAEWVVRDRERYRLEAAELAGLLAEIELARDQLEAAVDAARRSVTIDPFRDPSWRALVLASQRSGNTLAAERALHDYHGVLRSLGLPATAAQL